MLELGQVILEILPGHLISGIKNFNDMHAILIKSIVDISKLL